MHPQLGIRGKVLAVLALPVVVLAAGSAAVSLSARTDVDRARQTRAVSTSGDQLTQLTVALQAERLAAVRAAAGDAVARARLADLRATTDLTLGTARRALAAWSIDTLPVSAGHAVADVNAATDRLVQVRRLADDALPGGPDTRPSESAADAVPGATVDAAYSQVVAVVVDLPATVAGGLADRAAGVGLEAAGWLARAGEAVSREELAGLQLISAGRPDPVWLGRLAAADARRTDALARFRDLATPDQAAALDDALAGPVPAVTGTGTPARTDATWGPEVTGGTGAPQQTRTTSGTGATSGTWVTTQTRVTSGTGASSGSGAITGTVTDSGTGPELSVLAERLLTSGTAADRAAGTVDATGWQAAASAQAEAIRQVARQVSTETAALSAQVVDDAWVRVEVTLAVAVLLVGLSVLFGLMQSRRITAPLRRLTGVATGLAGDLPGLVERTQAGDPPPPEPDPVVRGRDEVGRLAAAFRDVHATTLTVAHEQAELRATVAAMFVNVARRNQVLLSRLLSLIDGLERGEEDPDALENLFRLDHLATRMRRNAESLLVLAGADSGRRLRTAMPLSDVLRTAVSEVEHYERVRLTLGVDPPVVGHLALATAHLFAELIENAAGFSDPGSPVVIASYPSGTGIRVTVTDQGIGMSAEEIERANARLSAPGSVDVMGSDRLGFFVVGRLAARLDSRVRLSRGDERGTVATVELSAALFLPGSTGAAAAATDREPVPLAARSVPQALSARRHRTSGRAVAVRTEPSPGPLPPPEPIAPQPVAEGAAATEPVTPEPAVPEPVAAESLSTESPTAGPAALEPATAEPPGTEPVSVEAPVAEPVSLEPSVTEPPAAQPLSAESIAPEWLTGETVPSESFAPESFALESFAPESVAAEGTGGSGQGPDLTEPVDPTRAAVAPSPSDWEQLLHQHRRGAAGQPVADPLSPAGWLSSDAWVDVPAWARQADDVAADPSAAAVPVPEPTGPPLPWQPDDADATSEVDAGTPDHGGGAAGTRAAGGAADGPDGVGAAGPPLPGPGGHLGLPGHERKPLPRRTPPLPPIPEPDDPALVLQRPPVTGPLASIGTPPPPAATVPVPPPAGTPGADLGSSRHRAAGTGEPVPEAPGASGPGAAGAPWPAHPGAPFTDAPGTAPAGSGSPWAATGTGTPEHGHAAEDAGSTATFGTAATSAAVAAGGTTDAAAVVGGIDTAGPGSAPGSARTTGTPGAIGATGSTGTVGSTGTADGSAGPEGGTTAAAEAGSGAVPNGLRDVLPRNSLRSGFRFGRRGRGQAGGTASARVPAPRVSGGGRPAGTAPGGSGAGADLSRPQFGTEPAGADGSAGVGASAGPRGSGAAGTGPWGGGPGTPGSGDPGVGPAAQVGSGIATGPVPAEAADGPWLRPPFGPTPPDRPGATGGAAAPGAPGPFGTTSAAPEPGATDLPDGGWSSGAGPTWAALPGDAGGSGAGGSAGTAGGGFAAGGIAVDEERLRHAIASEALSELSRLSTYRPERVSSSGPLTRRTPASTPAAATAEPVGLTASPVATPGTATDAAAPSAVAGSHPSADIDTGPTTDGRGSDDRDATTLDAPGRTGDGSLGHGPDAVATAGSGFGPEDDGPNGFAAGGFGAADPARSGSGAQPGAFGTDAGSSAAGTGPVGTGRGAVPPGQVRDADRLRRMLSGFQTGIRRARGEPLPEALRPTVPALAEPDRDRSDHEPSDHDAPHWSAPDGRSLP